MTGSEQLTISAAVRSWRTEHGLSLEQAGRRLGVSLTTVLGWERGRRPRDAQRRRLAQLLVAAGVDPRAVADLSSYADGLSPLRQARLDAGLSMAELAHTLFVSVSTLSHWELGVTVPQQADVDRIALALGIDLATAGPLLGPGRKPADAVRLPGLGAVRRRAGLTRRHVAGQLGISLFRYIEWDAGRVRVPLAELPSLADVLGMPTDTVLRLARQALVTPRPSELAQLRWSVGLSQRAAAGRLGIAPRTLSRLERGVHAAPPTLALLRRMASEYGVSLREVARAAGVAVSPMVDRAKWASGSLPTVLTVLRSTAGVSTRTIAERISVSAPTIRDWERGIAVPSRQSIDALERCYGLQPGELARIRGRPPSRSA